jgi:hypothetical protein
VAVSIAGMGTNWRGKLFHEMWLHENPVASAGSTRVPWRQPLLAAALDARRQKARAKEQESSVNATVKPFSSIARRQTGSPEAPPI